MAYIMSESGGDFSKVTAWTSQPLALNGHSGTCGCLLASETSLWKAD